MLPPETFDRIKALAEKAAAPEPLAFGGALYLTKPVVLPPKEEHEPALSVVTLTGLVDWFTGVSDTEQLPDHELVIHVEDARTVSVVGPPEGRYRQRYLYVSADATDFVEPFATSPPIFHGQEEFLIGLMTRFADGADRAALARFVGTIKDESTRVSLDDGISQVVTCSQGVTLVADVKLPNLVTLRGRRTFPELGPIEERFLLRVREGAKVALVPVESDSVRNEAISLIAAWLREKLPKEIIIA